MKLLFVVSSLDLTQPFSATPAWWQLLKGLYEIGVDVIAAPYQGPPIESLWWRAAANPAQRHGDLFKAARDLTRRVTGGRMTERQGDAEAASDRLVRAAAQRVIAPLWRDHLDRLLTREPDIDAVILLTAPLNHLVGVAGDLISRHGKPFFYYDGDVPASLPSMGGFASGFRIYQGADVREYSAFISNSQGGAEEISRLGARAVHVLYYGADPDVFSPVETPAQDLDVLFYGHGREYRGEWIDALIRDASNALPEARFAVRGTRLGDLGRAQALPYLSFSKLREYSSRSKVNLCITRRAHASVFASSSSRPFELASMGCCILANPYLGVETWFEPGKELFVVESGEEARDRLRFLLTHDAERRAAGRAARERVLKEHTFRHRAAQLVEIVRATV
ncbi:MAG: glycosyltransferase [Anaerolineae bacterium]|nr:glycosyltransferase [Anaerolineae bacterium]NUQ05842.1 glycosyltransferase [Anaerolineae bacterium]